MAPVDVRKGMPSVKLSREEFERRYRGRFFAAPVFKPPQRREIEPGKYPRPDEELDDPTPK